MQINNLARDNLHDKLELLSDLVTDEYWPWFANYMVVKRAAQVRRCSGTSWHPDCVLLACACCSLQPHITSRLSHLSGHLVSFGHDVGWGFACAGAKLPCAVSGADGADEQAHDGQAPCQHHIQVYQDPVALGSHQDSGRRWTPANYSKLPWSVMDTVDATQRAYTAFFSW